MSYGVVRGYAETFVLAGLHILTPGTLGLCRWGLEWVGLNLWRQVASKEEDKADEDQSGSLQPSGFTDIRIRIRSEHFGLWVPASTLH